MYWGVTVFLVVLASLICFAALFQWSVLAKIVGTILKILMPIFYGVVIAFLVDPIVRVTERVFRRIFKKRLAVIEKNPAKLKKTQKRWRAISIVIALMLVMAALAGLLWLVIPQIINSLSMMVDNFQGYYRNFSGWINDMMSNDSNVGNTIKSLLGEGFERVTQFINENVVPQAQKFLTDFTSGIIGFVWTLKDILIGIIIAIYFLFHKEKLFRVGE